MDEFSGSELDLETLNMILDGQQMQLDSKYGRVFEKRKNVGVILLGNSVPFPYREDSFRSRVFEVHFFSKCDPIDPGRLAATFCVLTAMFARFASFEAVTAVQAWQAGRSVVRIPLHPFGRTVEASGLRLSLSYVTAPQG